MIEKIWRKVVNRETISYIVFGVLTTLVDWVTYAGCRKVEIDYRWATVVAWIVAVLFAFVTNKFFVFESKSLEGKKVLQELVSFVTCRGATGIFTLVVMIVLVDGLGIKQDFICKVVVSAISLILNYVFSKLFIFKNANKQGV